MLRYEDDVLDVDIHDLLVNEQEALPLGQYTTTNALIGLAYILLFTVPLCGREDYPYRL